jgi:hypothetical protein
MHYHLDIMKTTKPQDVLDMYEPPTEAELLTITWLDRVANKLGNPPDLSTESGWKLMDAIVGVWMKHFPQEVNDTIHDRKVDLANEKSLHELVNTQSFGYNPMSIPPSLFRLIKVMFPNMRLQDKQVWKKLIAQYDFLRTSNYA